MLSRYLNVAVAVLFWISVNVQVPLEVVPLVTLQMASLALVTVPPQPVKVPEEPVPTVPVAVRVTKVPLA